MENNVSLLACWLNFIFTSLPPKDKTLTFTRQFQTGEEDKGEQMVGGVGKESHDVIAGGCHHYASGALNCCTDRRQRMNTLAQTKKTARNSIDIAHPSNIGTRVDLKLIRSGLLNSMYRQKLQPSGERSNISGNTAGLQQGSLYTSKHDAFKMRTRSINR